jgi:ubiquinone/menaquinone biosynthesis C-methylase UbiE
MKTLLHVGCGKNTKSQTTSGFNTEEWSEVRLDIDPSVRPDLLASITNMNPVESSSIDAIFSSHNIEHIFPHEIHLAFREFFRVLNDEGFVVITCPDLVSISKLVVEEKLYDCAYTSPAGPVAAIDMLYGHRASLESGKEFMAHRCGFTEKSITQQLRDVGFKMIATTVAPSAFALWALASKRMRYSAEMYDLAKNHFPLSNVAGVSSR